MQNKVKFIGNHHTIASHQHLSNGTANPGNRNKVKLRRTYGWLCPFDEYKSNKWYNVQRHINSVHGWDSGAPVDSKTGETREDKVSNAFIQRNFQNTLAPSIPILIVFGLLDRIWNSKVTLVRKGISRLHHPLICYLPFA